MLVTISLRLPYFNMPLVEQLQPTDYFGTYLFQYANYLADNRIVLNTLLTAITLSQALLFNSFLNTVRFLPQQNFLPSLVYVIFTAILPDFYSFSASLLIAFIIIWILHKLIQIYRHEKQYGAVFDLGFAIGVVTLISAHALVFALFAIVALAIMRPTTLVEWLNFLLGLFIPFFLIGTWSFYNHHINDFSNSILLNLKMHYQFASKPNISFYIAIGTTIVLIGANYILLKSRQLSRLVLVRKFFNVLFHLCWVTAASWFFNNDRSASSFYILAIPISFYFAYYLCLEKKSWKADLFIGIWVIAILYSQYYSKINLFIK